MNIYSDLRDLMECAGVPEARIARACKRLSDQFGGCYLYVPSDARWGSPTFRRLRAALNSLHENAGEILQGYRSARLYIPSRPTRPHE